jgi:hypothetical protein
LKTSYWNALFNDEPLGKFRIDFPMNGNAPVIYTDEDMGWPLPDVPMPSNIANFKEIHLWFAFSVNYVIINLRIYSAISTSPFSSSFGNFSSIQYSPM